MMFYNVNNFIEMSTIKFQEKAKESQEEAELSSVSPPRPVTPSYDGHDERSEMNRRVLRAIEVHNNEELARLLQNGASSNATCRFDSDIFAIHMAALSNETALTLLLEAGADSSRVDVYGRKPLHLAACAGLVRPTAILLGIPKDLLVKITRDWTPETEAEIIALRPALSHVVNTPVVIQPHKHKVEETWKDSRHHHRHHFVNHFPRYKPGWTPLHAASYTASLPCIRLLLAAGADPNLKDASERTPLDVAGSACLQDKCNAVNVDDFEETVKTLLWVGGQLKTTTLQMIFDSVLHTAVKLGSLDTIPLLLDAGAQIQHLSLGGQGVYYTPLHVCVMLRLKEHLKVLSVNYRQPAEIRAIDMTDSRGYTVLHLAVREAWLPGVKIALKAGADVTLKSLRGDTATHIAAEVGNLEILKYILYAAKQKSGLNETNCDGETPFSKAIYTKDMNIVLFMLNYDSTMENMLFRKLSTSNNMDPLEYAVVHDFTRLFNYILQVKRLDDRETIRLIDTMAKFNRAQYFYDFMYTCFNNDILNYDYSHVKYDLINTGYSLHTAITHGSRDMVVSLLEEGADLSQENGCGQTALSLIMYHITRPTEFLEDIFDRYIVSNDKNIYDPDFKITVNYRVLMPGCCVQNPRYLNPRAKQMNVLEALVETGNRHGQRRLLAHPLAETFLYLKWKKLSKFIYFMIVMYALFVLSMNAYLVSVFFHVDKMVQETDIPLGYDPSVWKYCIFVTGFLVCLLELFLWDLKKLCIYEITAWVKFGSIVLGAVMPIIITMDSSRNSKWFRDLASLSVILSWTNIMIYLSWLPTCGYYMQMLGKVSCKMLKVLLVLSFPLFCFSIIFMIQFHGNKPFDNPVAAFLKTTVMMTSEFDYGDLFKDAPSAILRIVFLLFLVFIAIVLMNLMVGVAVNDLQSLTLEGNLRQLEKQVKCLCTLETFFSKKRFAWPMRLLNTDPRNIWAISSSAILIEPTKHQWHSFKGRMREVITTKAQNLMDMIEKKADCMEIKKKLDKILEAVARTNIDIPDCDVSTACVEEDKLNVLIQNTVETTLKAVAKNGTCNECRRTQSTKKSK